MNTKIVQSEMQVYQEELWNPVELLVDLAWLWMCIDGLTGSHLQLLMENTVKWHI